MKRSLDDLRDALHDEADGAATPDVEAMVAGARRRVATTTRRRGLVTLGSGAAAALVVGGLVATTLSTHQVLPQPAGPSPHSVNADRPAPRVVPPTIAPEPGVGVPPTRPSVNLVPDGYHGRLRIDAMVLQSPEHGTQACESEAKSYPPQCSGPDIVGFHWGHLKAESAAGTKWGNYVLVGTFDGKKLTLTEPAVDSHETLQSPDPATQDADLLTTRCPKPAGGWRPVNPAKATDSAYQAAMRGAKAEKGFGDVWIDQPSLEGQPNDPRVFILNVTTTGDVAAMERRLRKVWGGSMCVSKITHTAVQLASAEAALSAKPLPWTESMGADDKGQFSVNLFFATTKQQRDLDHRFGAGTVRLVGFFVPID